MNTVHVHEFLVLAKLLNYSRAAQALYISQSVLTTHIQALEADLGVRLFDRDSHSVRLTEAGRILVMEAPTLLDSVDKAQELLRRENLPLRGSVLIGMELEISYDSHIRQFLSEFAARYPDLALEVEVIPGSTLPELTQRFDLLLTPCDYTQLPDGVEKRLIASHGIYAVLPPEHPLMAQSLIALHQLAGETLVVPYADEFFGPYAQNMLLAEKSTAGRLNVVKAPNLSTALFLTSIDKGICLAPRYVKNLLPPATFVIGISDRAAQFREYVYFNSLPGNDAARLFYEEFKTKFIRDV